VRGAVLPEDVPLTIAVTALRSLYPAPYVQVEQLTLAGQAQELAAAGFQVDAGWGTFMLKPLKAGLDFRQLMGVGTERFYLDPLDIT
ncbi:MAG TPA: hypothetical protein VD902_17050, partial [Symbiobacteriaceae bacterium]|nr:hypothetical protein [Symbiobacteriaceae bacterium]